MQCRICLEGPEGHSNPLRLRCACKTGAIHDACLIKWLSHKYKGNVSATHGNEPATHGNVPATHCNDIIPTCEICKSPFKGAILRTTYFYIKPAIYCARIVGCMHWIFIMLLLHHIHSYSFETLNCHNKHDIILVQTVCRHVLFLIEIFFRWIHVILAYKWACICYNNQIQKFPRNWTIKIRARNIILIPRFLNGIQRPHEFTFYEKCKSFSKMILESLSFIDKF